MVSEKNRKLFDDNEFLKKAVSDYYIEDTVAVDINCEEISFIISV